MKKNSPEKVLVTGGAGFIGSNLVDALVEEGLDVSIIDNLETGQRGNINPKANFFQVDIRKYEEIAPIFENIIACFISRLSQESSRPFVTRSRRITRMQLAPLMF